MIGVEAKTTFFSKFFFVGTERIRNRETGLAIIIQILAHANSIQ